MALRVLVAAVDVVRDDEQAGSQERSILSDLSSQVAMRVWHARLHLNAIEAMLHVPALLRLPLPVVLMLPMVLAAPKVVCAVLTNPLSRIQFYSVLFHILLYAIAFHSILSHPVIISRRIIFYDRWCERCWWQGR